MPVDIVTKGLSAASNLAAETGHPGKDIRPCVATLMEMQLQKGDFPDRNTAAVIIAYELQRIGFDCDSVYDRMQKWNHQSSPPLKQNELRKATDNGHSGKYKYGCENVVLKSFCVGDMCQFIKHVKSGQKRIINYKFLDYSWQQHLSNRQVLIYMLAIPALEIKRRVGPGGLVCANHMQVSQACGIDRRRLGNDLEVLASVGLIEYKSGTPRRWEGIASEIRRVIPIPRPTFQTIRQLKGLSYDT
ncbi:MAG: primase C-terminal domain-containing protein [bacterium]